MRSKALIALLATTGCVSHVEGEQPLNAEKQQIMNTLLSDEPLATAMAIALAKRMHEGMVQEDGKPGTATELVDAIKTTSEWLQTLHARGNIMEADPSLFATSDTIAQYDAENTNTHDDDRIVVTTDTKAWNLETLVHEAGHRTFNHNISVTNDIREGGAEYNEAFADAVITNHDYAYLLSALYAVPASILEEHRTEIQAAQEENRAPNIPNAQEAEDNLRESLKDNEGMFEQFGMSLNDVVDAYRESGIYENLTKERREAAREMIREQTLQRVDERIQRK